MTVPTTDSCTFHLYYKDTRIQKEEWQKSEKHTISEKAAEKTHNLICEYFDVRNEWDKKLFRTLHFCDDQLNWFEFSKREAPDVLNGIQIEEGRHLIFEEAPQENYKPLDNLSRKVHVKTLSVFRTNHYEISVEDLKGDRKEDFSVVSLYNSESFVRYIQCSTNLLFSRDLQLIDI